MSLIFSGLGLLLVVVNTIVTVAVFRSESYAPTQKLLQYFVIWLVPIVGAAFMWYVIREEFRSEPRNSYRGDNDFDDYPNHHHGQDGF